MKTAELQGDWLDYWVAKGLGCEPEMMSNGCAIHKWRDIDGSLAPVPLWDFSPSRRWRDGGPIIEREKIAVFPVWYTSNADQSWGATEPGYAVNYSAPMAAGPTSLVAAMRAYVASKYGEEVPDQESP